MHRCYGMFIIIMLGLAGCSPSLSTDDVEKVKGAVSQGLSAWQARKLPASLPDAWKFLDEDWKSGGVLNEYTIVKVTLDTDKLPRCWVTLKFTKQGKQIVREICYIVDLQRKLINRDPYS